MVILQTLVLFYSEVIRTCVRGRARTVFTILTRTWWWCYKLHCKVIYLKTESDCLWLLLLSLHFCVKDFSHTHFFQKAKKTFLFLLHNSCQDPLQVFLFFSLDIVFPFTETRMRPCFFLKGKDMWTIQEQSKFPSWMINHCSVMFSNDTTPRNDLFPFLFCTISLTWKVSSAQHLRHSRRESCKGPPCLALTKTQSSPRLPQACCFSPTDVEQGGGVTFPKIPS